MSDPLPGLRDELVAAAERLHRRRSRRRRMTTAVLGAAAAVAIGVGIVSVGTSEPAAAGVEITVVGERLQIELIDVETRPDFVEDALRDVGVDATVEAVPVGPSYVGRFIGGSLALPDVVEPLDPSGNSFPGFLIPIDFDEPIRLLIGRAAEPGETYAAAGDAYAPGEPLSCLGVYGSTLADAASIIPDDISVRVQPMRDGAPDGEPTALDTIDPDDRLAALVAIDAIALALDDVLLYATADGRSPFLEPVSPHRGACRD